MTSENVLENRENVPLKDGRKSRNLCDEDCLSGAKFINVAFATLTAIITAALLLQIYYGDYQVVPHGSVATDSLDCSQTGTAILKNGGNAIDAAIAAVFCLAVVAPHLTSLDAEAQVLIYNHRTRAPPAFIAIENGKIDPSPLPNLVFGMAYLHQEYGTRPWSELLQPSIVLARNGFLLSKMIVLAMRHANAEDVYGRLEPGQLLKLEVLANTLEEIAMIPEKTLYKYLTPTNSPTAAKAVKTTFANFDIYVPSGATIGPHFLSNLKQLQSYNFTPGAATKPEYIYRVAEVTQSLYQSLNITTNFHRGVSTNLAIMDLNDNYISLTTGLYDFFGSGEMTTKGYILDKKNRTSCSYLPIIVTDTNVICGRRMALGANDLAAASQLIMDLVIANENVSEAVEAPRFHLLQNGTIGIEGFHSPLFDEDVLQYLETLTATPTSVPEPYMSSNVVEKINDDLNSHSDSRGGGIASRF